MYEILENENNELIIPKFQSSTLNLLKKEFLLSVLRFERKMIEKSIMATPKSLIRSVYTHTFLFFFFIYRNFAGDSGIFPFANFCN